MELKFFLCFFDNLYCTNLLHVFPRTLQIADKCREVRIVYTMFFATCLHSRLNNRIMPGAHPREAMMLNLEVESPGKEHGNRSAVCTASFNLGFVPVDCVRTGSQVSAGSFEIVA